MPLRLRLALGQRAFHLLYTGLAPTYDAVAWAVSLGQWREWGQAALPYLSGPRVLELGHGPGHMLAALAAQGYEAVGLDLSPQMGRLARRQQPTPRLVRARAQVTPFAAGSFDGVLATFPTAYITAPATVAAVYRLLRPGGRLVIVPEAHLGSRGPLRALIDWLYVATGHRRPENEDVAARLSTWQATLAPAGFCVALHEVAAAESIVTIIVAERPVFSKPHSSDPQSSRSPL